ncbi:sigma-70 family RNA polymerase sigma factor [Actinomadura sp. HBU206391]|uniref:sigma-70 family RNA polymerase sigma factor n=1 Tax=Actinomadura sp. HBU206391 TaxID=2731692 RepID=UPI00164FAE4B|nr:sigma-70 family RNA polymerase sigma factor [Actinomadura sp. HBU206391]MBC6457829.1 sigma-70 family RNA polymerase sigma factor [Actinomadura sp. HBU206391]
MGTARDTAAAPEPLVAELYRGHFTRMVRLAALLGADDPEDVAQEAFARLHRRQRKLRDPQAALPYLRATVCNLVRNRHRHLRVARLRAPAVQQEASSEQTALLHEDHREVLAALAQLPARQREALTLRYWHDLSEQEIAEAMGVSTGTVKTHTSRGIAALTRTLEEKR